MRVSDESLRIVMEAEPSAEDREAVLDGLRGFNRRHAPGPTFRELALFARDAAGRIRGGLLGEIGWEWLHVQILWLDEAYRGRGYGSQLLATAEREARTHGCRGVYLDTLEFQARPFYERHGYSVFGVLNDFPPGFRRFFLQKKLS
jgi:GNAT superfamily N-acetyltransferase